MSRFGNGFGGAVASVFVALLIAAGVGCEMTSSPSPPPAVSVVATSPVVRPVVEWDEYVGRFEAVDEVAVRARVSGHLESIHFVEGQIVQAGELLFVLDQRPFQIAVDQASADLAGAKGRATEASAQVQLSEAEERSAVVQRDLAASMVERLKAVAGTNAVSREEIDVRQSNLRRAQADVDAASARIVAAKAAVSTADTDVRAAEARLKNAQLDLDYTEVRAPVSGRAGDRLVTIGNLVLGGAESATELTTIVSLDPIHCYFDIDERSYLKYMRQIESGAVSDLRESDSPVLVSLADDPPGYAREGRLDFLDNRLDRATATMRARAVLKNERLLLTPGSFAKVRLPGSPRRETTLVAETAIGTDQAEKFVYVIDAENTVQRRKVDLGPRADGLRIVRSGLSGSEKIVLRGIQRVRPGVAVEPSFEETIAQENAIAEATDRTPVSGRVSLADDRIHRAETAIDPGRASHRTNAP